MATIKQVREVVHAWAMEMEEDALQPGESSDFLRGVSDSIEALASRMEVAGIMTRSQVSSIFD